MLLIYRLDMLLLSFFSYTLASRSDLNCLSPSENNLYGVKGKTSTKLSYPRDWRTNDNATSSLMILPLVSLSISQSGQLNWRPDITRMLVPCVTQRDTLDVVICKNRRDVKRTHGLSCCRLWSVLLKVGKQSHTAIPPYVYNTTPGSSNEIPFCCQCCLGIVMIRFLDGEESTVSHLYRKKTLWFIIHQDILYPLLCHCCSRLAAISRYRSHFDYCSASGLWSLHVAILHVPIVGRTKMNSGCAFAAAPILFKSFGARDHKKTNKNTNYHGRANRHCACQEA